MPRRAGRPRWYLIADPAQIDTVEYCYLEGQQGVYIETKQGFEVDGVEIKARMDFGAAALDYRGLQKNAGAVGRGVGNQSNRGGARRPQQNRRKSMQNYVQKGQTLTVVAPYALTERRRLPGGQFFGVSVNSQSIGDSSGTRGRGRVRSGEGREHVHLGRQGLLGQHASSWPRPTADGGGVSNKEIGFAVLGQASGVAAPGGQAGDATVRVRLNPLGFGPVQACRYRSVADPEGGRHARRRRRSSRCTARRQSILPAPAAGQVLVIDQIIAQMKPGGTQFTGGGAVSFQYHGTGVVPHSGNIPAATITSATAQRKRGAAAHRHDPAAGRDRPRHHQRHGRVRDRQRHAGGDGVLLAASRLSLSGACRPPHPDPCPTGPPSARL